MMDENRLQIFNQFRTACTDFVYGQSKLDNCVKKIMDFIIQRRENASILFDVLESLDIDVDCNGEQNFKDRFKELCKKLTQVVLPEDLLKANLDLFADDGQSSRYIKMKTKLFYKQLKFNLLREESEGYAKLWVELNQPLGKHGLTPSAALERVRCLIGQFNLDPNRVLDLILECFECRLDQSQFFLTLLRLYRANPVDICHLLGFKFTFHQSGSSKGGGDKMEEEDDLDDFDQSRHTSRNNIYRLSALLIRDNLLDLPSLCCYLTPKLESMLQENKKYLDQLNTKQKKLGQTSIASDKDSAECDSGSSRIDISDNQKLSLLLALLEVGEWKYAKHLLDRMPEFYAVRYPEVSVALCRLLDRQIDGLYQKLCSAICHIRSCFESQTFPPPAETPGSSTSRDPGVAKKDTLAPNQENLGAGVGAETARVETLAQLAAHVFPVAVQLGPTVAYDAVLYTKLIRLCTAFMDEKSKNPRELDQYYPSVIELCEEVLVPALSLSKDNCSISEELWLLIKQFPYIIRYRFYGRWKNEHMRRHPSLIAIKGEVMGKTRYIMKRLSKETVKVAGRQIGKLSHSNPSVVFDIILNQVQQFENFIQPVVESLKFVTSLSYDVLAYCIIEHLSSPEKEKLKVSDATLSPWLQSLALFVGSVFKKYSTELTGVLQYVANQLKTGKSFDLCVLREIIENMSGVETTGGLKPEQVEALAGGDILKQEGAFFNQERKNTKRSISRLKEALMQEDLVVSLCILMAQQRGSIVHKEGVGIHLKLVGQMLDQCQETLVQFASFLSANLKSEDYVKYMPSVVELIRDYHVTPDAAMFLSRPVYVHSINSMYDELKRADRLTKTLNLEKKTQHYKIACSKALEPLIDELTGQIFLPTIWQDMSPKLFTAFWTLSAYDIYLPTGAYEREYDKLRKSIQQMDESRDANEIKRKKEREQKLLDEQRRQVEHVNRVHSRLMAEKEEWFQMGARNASINRFLQYCVYPRCVFTDIDAIFCAKFIKMVHALKTSNFGTIGFFDKLLFDITPMIAYMTENEAHHYGRFLCACIEIIASWKDKDTFEKECTQFPGFFQRMRFNEQYVKEKENVDYDFYMQLYHRWNLRLTKAFIASLSSNAYVPIRNALLILIKVLPQFPADTNMASAIGKRIGIMKDKEKNVRQDLHVLAVSYLGQLKMKKLKQADGYEKFYAMNKNQQPQSAASKQTIAASLTRKLQQQQQSSGSEEPAAKTVQNQTATAAAPPSGTQSKASQGSAVPATTKSVAAVPINTAVKTAKVSATVSTGGSESSAAGKTTQQKSASAVTAATGKLQKSASAAAESSAGKAAPQKSAAVTKTTATPSTEKKSVSVATAAESGKSSSQPVAKKSPAANQNAAAAAATKSSVVVSQSEAATKKSTTAASHVTNKTSPTVATAAESSTTTKTPTTPVVQKKAAAASVAVETTPKSAADSTDHSKSKPSSTTPSSSNNNLLKNDTRSTTTTTNRKTPPDTVAQKSSAAAVADRDQRDAALTPKDQRDAAKSADRDKRAAADRDQRDAAASRSSSDHHRKSIDKSIDKEKDRRGRGSSRSSSASKKRKHKDDSTDSSDNKRSVTPSEEKRGGQSSSSSSKYKKRNN